MGFRVQAFFALQERFKKCRLSGAVVNPNTPKPQNPKTLKSRTLNPEGTTVASGVDCNLSLDAAGLGTDGRHEGLGAS